MKLEVGMYVRSKNNFISKIIVVCPDREKPYVFKIDDKYCEVYGYKENQIKKASHNIIDLIEIGDYVNGNIVYVIDKEYGVLAENDVFYKEEDIKSIVTKEQFEIMSYKVGD